MIAEFIKKTLYFSGSVFVYSGVRHLIFLPMLSDHDLEAFRVVGQLLFVIDIVFYTFAGALSDYYVRLTKGGNNNIHLLDKLTKYSLLGLASIFFYRLYIDDVFISAILGIYIVLSAMVALNLKVFFNRLEFTINYRYIAFRLIPYGITMLAVALNSAAALWIFCTSLALSEYAFLRVIRKEVRVLEPVGTSISDVSSTRKAKWSSILGFIAVYSLIGFTQRGDVALAEYFIGYAEIVKYVALASVLNFFCNPIAVMTSSSLLAFLVNKRLDIRRIFFPSIILILCISSLIALVSAALFPTVMNLLYSAITLDVSYGQVFFIVFSIVLYSIIRTFVIRFSDTTAIFCFNILFFISILILWLNGVDGFIDFAVMYCALRALIYFLIYMYAYSVSILSQLRS